jgi:hypothetical protein
VVFINCIQIFVICTHNLDLLYFSTEKKLCGNMQYHSLFSSNNEITRVFFK